MNKEQELREVLDKLPEELRHELELFFLDRADKTRSVASRLLYAYTALSLVRHAGIRSLRELDRQRYLTWKRAMVSGGASDFTIRSYVTRIKALMRWLHGQVPDWLRGEASSTWQLYSKGEHLRDKVLRAEELEALLRACDNVRDLAIIGILAETGLRIGELLSLRLRDIEVLPDGSFRLNVRGKTGVRTVVVIRAAKALATWLRERPGPKDLDSPVFTTMTKPYRPLRPGSFRAHLRNIAKRAGLKRPVHPHMLRHTCMTRLARILTEQELKVVAGWTKNSPMATVYVHLSGRDAERALRKAYEALRKE